MPVTWPEDLPQCFLYESYSTGKGDGRLRHEVDQGPAIVRRRFQAVVRPVSGTMSMTLDQMIDFLTFVDTTLLGMTLPFEFPAQRGESEDPWLVRFSEPPSWQDHGHGVLVSMNLEILP